MADIHAILEEIKAAKDAAVDLKKVLSNGQLDLGDLLVVKDILFSQMSDFSSAVKDLGEALAEAKDLDVSEVQQIGAAMIDLWDAFKGA